MWVGLGANLKYSVYHHTLAGQRSFEKILVVIVVIVVI